MTSISSALKIINADLDAENRRSLEKTTHINYFKLGASRKTMLNTRRSSVVASLEKSHPYSYAKSVTLKAQLERNVIPARHQTQRSQQLYLGDINSCKIKEDSEHVVLFQQIMNLFSLYGKPIGTTIAYDWTPKRHIMFWFCCLLLIFSWFTILYTQAIHMKNSDMLRVLEATAMYGIGLSCIQKILGYLRKRRQIIALFFSIRKICRENLSGSHLDILKSHLIQTLKYLKLYAVGVTSCLGLFVACPIKAYFVDKELMPLLPIEIIFVNQTTYFGFGVGNLVMSVMGMYAASGTIFYGALFIYCILMYALKVDLIGNDFKDLDEMWADEASVPLHFKHAYLKNICKKRQDLKNYMSTIKDTFEKKLSFYFLFNYFSQVICLFEITKNQWIPGYALAIGLLIEMMFYCIMGTKITVENEKLCSYICATNWYTYDLHSQKILLMMLYQCQRSEEMKLGPLGSLNVMTGIEVVKSIYSYYTILTELL